MKNIQNITQKVSIPNVKLSDSQKELMLASTKNVKGFWNDFRDFAVKGNVIDLAVGVVIGGAFNTIVQSLVNDIIMPIVGAFLGNSAFEDLFINLSDKYYETLAQAVEAGAPVIKYGVFITNVINFFIIALSIFVVLKIFFRKRNEKEVEEAINS